MMPKEPSIPTLIHAHGDAEGMHCGHIIYPMAGQICLDQIDHDLPEVKAVDEMFKLLAKYRRRPPQRLLAELFRRQEALSKRLRQGVYKRFAECN